MRAWLVLGIGVLAAGGCEAPSEEDPAAQPGPLEAAIGRGGFPDPVARLLRRLATLPPGSSLDAAVRHLGLADEPDGGSALEEHECLYWDVAPGYRVYVSNHLFPLSGGPPAVDHVNVAAQREAGNWDAGSAPVFPCWAGGRLRYE